MAVDNTGQVKGTISRARYDSHDSTSDLYFPLFEHFFSHNERPKIFICGVSRQHYQNQGVALITGVRLPSESDHATAVRRALEATGFQRPSVECSLDGR